MRAALRRTLYDGLRRLEHLISATGIVLLYHRIHERPPDPYQLTVPPERFREHLEVVRRVGVPVPLHHMVDALRRGRPIRRAICITFDDAYQDTLYAAKPLLERYDVPATVFATTGCGREREFWWDELARIFLEPSLLPPRLAIEIDDRPFEWNLGDSGTRDGWDSAVDDWTFNDDEAPTARHEALLAIYERLRTLDDPRRAAALDRLLDWAGLAHTVRPSHRALDPEELVDIEEGGLVNVGAHTVTHPSLPALPEVAQKEEISRSMRTLAEWLGHPVRGFAYPYGHFTEASESAVAEAGFDHACSSVPEPVRRTSPPLAIPRVEVADWAGDTLERRLRWYLGR